MRIAGRLDMGADGYIGPSAGSGVSPADMLIVVLGQNGNTGKVGATPKAAVFGLRTTMKGNVRAPKGTLWAHAEMALNGTLFGRWVQIGRSSVLTFESSR